MKIALAAALAATLLATSAPSARAQSAPRDAAVVAAGAAPGKAAAGAAVTRVATVEAIDAATRTLTLKTPEGRLTRIVAGPEVRNFERIAVGDRIVVRYAEAVSLRLRKQAGGIRERAESADATRAPEGAKPGMAATHRVTVLADVIGADPRTRVLTLRGPEHTIELRVPDAKQFTSVRVGDQVEAVFTEALAVSVEPAAGAPK